MKTSDRVMETVWPWWKAPESRVAESCGRRALIQAAILAAVGAGPGLRLLVEGASPRNIREIVAAEGIDLAER